MLYREIKINVVITPEELASEFCNFSADQQALFFNAVAEQSKSWIHMQLAYISGAPVLTDEGRLLMQVIGEYGQLGG